MNAFLVAVNFCILLMSFVTSEQVELKCDLKHGPGSRQFPQNFTFGVSTAAYQVEGAWNIDGKGPSIWDTFTHKHSDMIDDHSSGDIAADSYHRFEQDLVALKELKVHFYRLSISWPRILPNGDISSINQKGIDYYNMVIDKLLSNGIQPMVTMYHYDMPEELNKFGGLTNDIFISYFFFYADLLFKTFGDRVKTWTTFNEPFDYCIPGYGNANYPPMVQAPGIADYLCMDNTLRAHALVYRLYKTQYFPKQGGKIGITLSSRYYFTKTNDLLLIDRALQYSLGWLAEPLLGNTGQYPAVMLEDISANSKAEGRGWSRLRPISEQWMSIINGSIDYLGLNYYTSRYVEKAKPPVEPIPSWTYDSNLVYTIDERWKRGKSSWLYCVPEGLEGLLKWIRDHYNNVEVIITENGWSDDGRLDDDDRISYLKAHLQAVLNAINDGCNVTRYTHWSLIDNFEWQRGYTEKFGLYYVNMTSANKERVPKNSARYYKSVIESRRIIDSVV